MTTKGVKKINCSVIKDNIVLTIPITDIEFYAKNYQKIKITNSDFYHQFANTMVDKEDCSGDGDLAINLFLDEIFKITAEDYPEYLEEIES